MEALKDAAIALAPYAGSPDEALKLELERAQAAAKAASERLSTFLETTTDCVFTLDRQWRFTYLNIRAIEEIAGGRDLVGVHVSTAFEGLSQTPFWQHFSQVMWDRVPRTAEGYFDPLKAWFEVHVTATDDGVVAFFRNITRRKEAEKERRLNSERWQTMLDAVPQMVWSMEPDGTEYFNRRWSEFVGAEVGGENGVPRIELVHPHDRASAQATWQASFATGQPYEASYRLIHRSGEYRWLLSRAEALPDDEGNLIRWVGSCTDVHEQVLAKQRLQRADALNRSIIEASPDCISLLDTEGTVQFMNEAALRALGSDGAKRALGSPWGASFPASVRGPARMAVEQARHGRVGHFSASQPTSDAQKWWDVVVAPVRADGDETTGLVAIARDITHQKSAEDRVRWAADHDALTALPNRSMFQRRLDQLILRAEQTGSKLTVLMLDLDDFKRTNDALGHDAGDALLTSFAQRLRQAVRADDLVARLGGDEFAIVLNDVWALDEIEAAVASIFDHMREPCIFDGKLLDIRTSIGASTYPEHGSRRPDLLKSADIALYVAKAGGRGVLRVFEPQMRAEAQGRISMLAMAKDALDHQRVVSFYQPKVDLRSKRLNGFEALLRWKHPSRGLQSPSAISAAFEDVTLAAEISDRMIDTVISDMRGWLDAGVEFQHVSINAAAAEFRRGDFANRLLERLHRADVPPRCVQLEVTETVFVGRGGEYVERALKTLSAAGIEIALDDFGTGFASLSHLKLFPVNVLKIDRSFVKNISADEDDAAIVRAVVSLGRTLGIEVVAEGIETSEQEAFLKRFRCHVGQGYLFGKPAPAAQVPQMVEHWKIPAENPIGR